MFHVYVEGVTRAAPDATRRVSDAMAERYGLSADEVYSLMCRGRFRVKAHVDQATADRYARELEALGARVQIEEARRHGRTLPPQDRAGAGTAPPAPRGAAASTKSPPLTPAGESPHGLLMPLREEVRDRAADPAACGPRHRMSPASVSTPLSALRDAALDPDEDGESVVRHRASWPSRPQSGAPSTPWPAHLDSRSPVSARRAPVSTPPRAMPRAAFSTPASEPEPRASGWAAFEPPEQRPAISALPPDLGPQQESMSALPPQRESRPSMSALPPQRESRPSGSPLPPQPASRPTASPLPPQPASRPTRPSLPAHGASRPTPPSLPAHGASRPMPTVLPPDVASRPARSSLPPDVASRPARSSLPPHVIPRSTPPSLPPQNASRPAPRTLSPHVIPRSTPASLPQQGPSPVAEATSSLDFAGLDDPPIQLGALERSGLLALATLDDNARSGSAAPSSSADPFAPPGGELDDVLVDLDDDVHERRTTPRPAVNDEVTARGAAPTPDPEPTRRGSAPSLDPGSGGSGLALEVTPRMAALGAAASQQPPSLNASPPIQPGALLSPNAQSSTHAGASASPNAQSSTHAGGAPNAQSSTHAGASTSPSSPSPAEPGTLRSHAATAPSSPVLAPTPRREPPAPPRTRLATHAQRAASPRARFAAGVALAIVLGFIPAHIVSSVREDRAFRPIDAQVTAVQAAADTLAAYNALDAIRAEQLGAKHSARNTIALTSMMIWAAASAAVAYVWFRRRPG